MIDLAFYTFVLANIIQTVWVIYRDISAKEQNKLLYQTWTLQRDDLLGRKTWEKVSNEMLEAFQKLRERVKDLEDSIEYEVTIDGDENEAHQ